jgi:hypothetical protein
MEFVELSRELLLGQGRGSADDTSVATERPRGSAVGLMLGTAKATGTGVRRFLGRFPKQREQEQRRPEKDGRVYPMLPYRPSKGKQRAEIRGDEVLNN